MGENNKQLQDMEITFRNGAGVEVYVDIIGYQVSGTVLAVVKNNGETVIYPFVDIERVNVFAREQE